MAPQSKNRFTGPFKRLDLTGLASMQDRELLANMQSGPAYAWPEGTPRAEMTKAAKAYAKAGNRLGWMVVLGIMHMPRKYVYQIMLQPEPTDIYFSQGYWFGPIEAYPSHNPEQSDSASGAPLHRVKFEARELARRGNDMGWKVVVGRSHHPGGFTYSILFQQEPERVDAGPGYYFEPIASYASHKPNPTPGAQLRRQFGTKVIAARLQSGGIYFGESYDGRPLSVGPYQGAEGRPTYGLFVGNVPIKVSSASDIVAQFMALAKPETIRPSGTTAARYNENPLGWRKPVRPAPGAAHVDWKAVSEIVNKALAGKTDVFTRAGKRALVWFLPYSYSKSSHSISRTDARYRLGWVDINLDKLVEQAINDSFGEYALNPTREVPETVERYYQEGIDQGMPEAEAWAVAWSRYCKYKDPESKHCHLRQAEYFPGKGGKGSKGADKTAPVGILLKLNRRGKVAERSVQVDSAGTDLWKKADVVLKERAMGLDPSETMTVEYEVAFDDGSEYFGVVDDFGKKWVRSDDLARSTVRHLMFMAGRGAPPTMTPAAYAKYLRQIDPSGEAGRYASDLLDRADFGAVRPPLPTKLPSAGKRPTPRRKASSKRPSARKASKVASGAKRRSSPRRLAAEPAFGNLPRAKGDKLRGGFADAGMPIGVDSEQFRMGIEVEREHSDDPRVQREIAADHLTEDPTYYTKLATIEDEDRGKFERSLQGYLRLVQQGLDQRYGAGKREVGIDRGKRYVRVWERTVSTNERSVVMFVDTQTGNLLAPDGWKKPRTTSVKGSVYSYLPKQATPRKASSKRPTPKKLSGPKPTSKAVLAALDKFSVAFPAPKKPSAKKPSASKASARAALAAIAGPARPIEAKGHDFTLMATPEWFSVQQNDINLTTLIAPTKASKTATKRFYAWAVAHESQLPNMTFSQVNKALDVEAIKTHMYCAMD